MVKFVYFFFYIILISCNFSKPFSENILILNNLAVDGNFEQEIVNKKLTKQIISDKNEINVLKDAISTNKNFIAIIKTNIQYHKDNLGKNTKNVSQAIDMHGFEDLDLLVKYYQQKNIVNQKLIDGIFLNITANQMHIKAKNNTEIKLVVKKNILSITTMIDAYKMQLELEKEHNIDKDNKLTELINKHIELYQNTLDKFNDFYDQI